MIWLLSPFLYKGFVETCRNFVKPYFTNIDLIERVKNIHNFSLSLFSGAITYLSGIEIYNQLPDYSINTIVCTSFQETPSLMFIVYAFYLSKYWEWIDTLFLILKDKRVSTLHYYHHSSTPILSYINTMYISISPSYIYAVFLNCLVHTIMYWYYLFPRGFMRKHKRKITQLQIFQHIYMLLCTVYIGRNCFDSEKNVVYYTTIGCYSFYFIMFCKFYLKSYIINVPS